MAQSNYYRDVKSGGQNSGICLNEEVSFLNKNNTLFSFQLDFRKYHGTLRDHYSHSYLPW